MNIGIDSKKDKNITRNTNINNNNIIGPKITPAEPFQSPSNINLINSNNNNKNNNNSYNKIDDYIMIDGNIYKANTNT